MAVSYSLKNAYLYIDNSASAGYASISEIESRMSAITDQSSLLGYAEVRIGTGRITWNAKQTIEYTLNRGKVSPNDGGLATQGDDQPLDVSFECTFEYYTGGAQTNPKLLMTVNDNQTCSPAPVDLYVFIDSDCADQGSVLFFFPEFRWETFNFDPNAGTMAVAGKCRVTRPGSKTF